MGARIGRPETESLAVSFLSRSGMRKSASSSFLIPCTIRVLARRVAMQHVLRMAVLLFRDFDLVWRDTPYSERRWHEACTPQGKSQNALMHIWP